MSIIAAIVVVTNLGFTAGFDTATRQPSWVAYDLEPHEVVRSARMSASFAADPRIGEPSDNWTDYYKSGYDRGHLAPAADMNWSTNALREAHLFSNICPQTPNVNRGKWRKTEEEVRSLAASTTVHVVIVPLFREEQPRTMGRLPVPSHFIKVAYGEFGSRVWTVENK